MENKSLGFAGKLAQAFANSKLTLVFAIAAILLGIFAVSLTPKEEEPQISVPMIDVSIGAPGLGSEEIEKKITEVVEHAAWGLDGVEYVYSTSGPSFSLVTIRFKVGEPIEPSLVKVHHKMMEIRAELPTNSTSPMVKSFSIDDVPFLTLTYSSDQKSGLELRTLAANFAKELSSTPDLNHVDILGGQKRVVRVIADPEQIKAHGVSLLSLANAIEQNNLIVPAGKTWGASEIYDVEVGGRPESKKDIEGIAIGQRGGSVVRVGDVAKVIDGPEEFQRVSVLYDKKNSSQSKEAVSISFTKRKGTNVVTLAEKILHRTEQLNKILPSDVQMNITRNYGETAKNKSNELIEHLLIATLSVTALIALFMGLRASLVVAIAIPVTLALTLAIYYFLGYTLNRVTLFALIFSIGILVDDAIVVVENIERHLHLDKNKSLLTATIEAVSEVGNPTILATMTVIAAILPMAFVRGLMGPYMKPIPVGASLAMIVSLFVAFIVTPWAAIRLLKKSHTETDHTEKTSKLDQIYQRVMSYLLAKKRNSILFGLGTTALMLMACSFVYFKVVKVKMLPFDNKNEFQVLVDYPSKTTISENKKFTKELAQKIFSNDSVEDVQIYIGEPAPFSFSGMVKHVFLRGREDQADLQIVLKDKEERKESSHQIIESIRPVISQFGKDHQAITKVLEIPPGPPVLATMLAEIYGPTQNDREAAAQKVLTVMSNEPSVVDLDSSNRPGRPRRQFHLDFAQAGALGTNSNFFAATGKLLFSESTLGLMANTNHPEDIPIVMSVDSKQRTSANPFEALTLPSFETGFVEATDISKPQQISETKLLYRKNLKPVIYVMSELSGKEEAPVYGMFKITPKLADIEQQTAEVPWDTSKTVIKWDGEWFITYEVFRDLGSAFAVVMILIYILVLGWFKSFRTPLIIMAPIPISLIGILSGHAITGVYFTATSMIGFIAGAGIIVRNSIILVDFIEHLLQSEKYSGITGFHDAVIDAGIVRFRPMLLTAAAVVVGSSVMLFDPIFQGLAVSLIFGEIAATLISRFAVPVLYFWFGQHKSKEIK